MKGPSALAARMGSSGKGGKGAVDDSAAPRFPEIILVGSCLLAVGLVPDQSWVRTKTGCSRVLATVHPGLCVAGYDSNLRLYESRCCFCIMLWWNGSESPLGSKAMLLTRLVFKCLLYILAGLGAPALGVFGCRNR